MADIINNPAPTDSGGTGVLFGGILFIVLALLFVFYGLPAMRGASQSSVPNAPVQEAPKAEGGDGGTIVIPDEIDVTVNQTEE